jgi:iron complex outermembrane receptor protein
MTKLSSGSCAKWACGAATVALLSIIPTSDALADEVQKAVSAKVDANVLEEIVVTATRREENLRDVPVAVTAVTSAVIESRLITDVGSLQRLAPSMTAVPFGDATTPLIALRGLAAQDIVITTDPAVGIYLDGIYLGRSTGGNLGLVDTNRVEVLRGPQGTLFGRNTIGGAVSITPNHPVNRFEASINGTYGNYNQLVLTGMVNVPVSEGTAIRIAASHRQHDGFAKSSITGAELNAEKLDYVRGSLSTALGSNWNLLVSGDFTESKNLGQWITAIKMFPLADLVAAAASGGTQTASQYVDPFTDRVPNTANGGFLSRNWGVSAILSGEIGTVNFKSLTSYREVKRSLNGFDQDGTPFELLQILSNITDQHQFSQEFQLFGKAMSDRLDWIVGAYYFGETGRDTVTSHFDYPLGPNYSITDAKGINRNYAAYGQLTFAITDQLALVGGVRYAHDTRKMILFSRNARPNPSDVISCAVAAAALPACVVDVPGRSFSYAPFSVGLNYKPGDNALLYAKFSRGYRSGGFNTRGVSESVLLPFNPESVDSYEIGAKMEFAHRYRLNAAGYIANYKDVQILAIIPNLVPTVAITQNAGTARIKGIELEGDAAFGPLKLSGSLAITDAKYLTLAPGVLGLVQASPFVFTPKTAWSVSGDYTQPFAFGKLVLHADYSWRSTTYFAASPPADPLNKQDGYGLVNGSVSAKIGDHFSVSVFGKNLADKRYFQRITNLQAVGFLSGYVGDPRTYGISGGYKF